MKALFTVMAICLISLSLAACKDKEESKVTESSVINGTEVDTTTTRTTTMDGDEKTIEVEREQTVDPEGLMNKETTTEEFKTETEISE